MLMIIVGGVFAVIWGIALWNISMGFIFNDRNQRNLEYVKDVCKIALMVSGMAVLLGVCALIIYFSLG